jgi:hypothetical protein
MTEPGEVEEHPTVTLADKVGAKVAEHVAAASKANAATETARRHASTLAMAESLRNEIKPAMAEMMAEIIGTLPDDHPSRKFFELFQSPQSILDDAVINILGLLGMVMVAMSNAGQVFFQPALNSLWAGRPNKPMAPADAANAVVQGYVTMADGAAAAAEAGFSESIFNAMVEITGMPPSPQDLFAMFRRDLMPEGESASQFPSVYAGLAQGHTKDEWIPLFQKLAYVWPTPDLFVNAAVREQFTSKSEAQAWAAKAGLDVTTQTEIGNFFDVMFDVAGRPPGPVEAAHMAHRNIIPWTGTGAAATTFQQAIAESDLKTKWTTPLQDLSTYVLTNGEIDHLVRQGILDKTTAVPYYAKNAVAADLAAIMVESALSDKLAEDRQLAKGEVLTMYQNQLLTRAEAVDALNAIGYHSDLVTELLALADFRREATVFNRIIQVLGRQVVTGKLSLTNANATLAKMGVPSQTITILLADWELSKQVEVPALSEGTIVAAAYYGIETPDEAMADLKSIGYTPYDAWRLLSARMHGPVTIAGGYPPRTQGV